MNNEIYKEPIESIRSNTKLIPVSEVCLSCMLHVYGCVFCSIPLLFVYLHMHVFKSKVHCGIVNRFSRALSGLTIIWHATCVVVSNKQKKRQKKSMTVRYR